MRLATALSVLSVLACSRAFPQIQAHHHVASGGSADPAHLQVESRILSVTQQFSDPVEAMIALDPQQTGILAEVRELEVFDGLTQPGVTRKMTEGDKLRLRRQGIDFIDWTGRSLVTSDYQASAGEGLSRPAHPIR